MLDFTLPASHSSTFTQRRQSAGDDKKMSTERQVPGKTGSSIQI